MKGLQIVHYNRTAKTWLVTVNGYYTLPPQTVHPYSPDNKVCAAIIARGQDIQDPANITPERTRFILTRGKEGSL